MDITDFNFSLRTEYRWTPVKVTNDEHMNARQRQENIVHSLLL